MDLSIVALLIVVAVGAHGLGLRGCAALIVAVLLLSVGGASLLMWGLAQAETHGGAFLAAFFGVAAAGALLWRFLWNALVEADFRRAVQNERKKADGRRI